MEPDEIIAELAKLGIDRQTYRVLLVLPLLQVAWADGEIQPAEQELILQAAAKNGLDRGPGEGLVKNWLRARPSEGFFQQTRALLAALLGERGGVGADLGDAGVQELLDLCEQVAAAAGGLFDLVFTISEDERGALNDIATGLSIGPSIDWDALIGVPITDETPSLPSE